MSGDPHRLRNFSTYPFPCPDCGTSVAAGTIHTFPECVATLKATNESLVAQVRHAEEWDEEFQCIHCRYYEPLTTDEDGGDAGVFCCFTNTGKGDRVACGEWELAAPKGTTTLGFRL